MSRTHSELRLQTPRLILRPLAPDDAAHMTPLAADAGVARMTTSIPHPFSQDMASDFIARMQAADHAREMVLTVERADGVFMGVLGIHPTDGLAPELGYWIGRPFWGAGYMTEAEAAPLDVCRVS